jgi:hypothetical protein
MFKFLYEAIFGKQKTTTIPTGNQNQRTIKTKVVGVTFENRQELLKKCYNGQKLRIINRPMPKYPHAMAVYAGPNNIGHIADELAQELFQNKNEYTGIILNLTGGTSECPTRGCNIEIYT